MYTITWRFRVRPGREKEFEELNGPGGEWAALFSSDPAYLNSALIRGGPGDYVTIDRWRSKLAYEQFLQKCRAKYVAIDIAASELTMAEALIGAVTVPD